MQSTRSATAATRIRTRAAIAAAIIAAFLTTVIATPLAPATAAPGAQAATAKAPQGNAGPNAKTVTLSGGVSITNHFTAARQAACTPPNKLGVVFVIDDSGSMSSSDPTNLRVSALTNGLQELGAGAVASTVAFGTSASVVTPPTEITTASMPQFGIDAAAAITSSGGGTNYERAFTAASEQLAAMPATVDRKAVVFLSDGQATSTFTADQAIAASGVAIYPIGFGQASSAVLSGIAARSGGVASFADTAAAAQGAMARAAAYMKCNTVNLPEIFELPPGGSREIPFDVPAGAQGVNILASWGSGNLLVELVRPDGSVLGAGALRPGETYTPSATSVRVTIATPAAGRWKVRVTAARENVETIQVAIDVLGDGGTQHPMNQRPAPAAPGCETEVNITGRVAWSRCFVPVSGGWKSELPVRVAGIDFAPAKGKSVRLLNSGVLKSDNAEMSVTTSGPLLPGGTITLRSGSIHLPLGGASHMEFEGSSKSKGKRAKPRLSVGGLEVVAGGGMVFDWTASGAELDVALDLGRDFATILGPSNVDGSGRHSSPADRARQVQRGFGLAVKLTTSNSAGLSVRRLSGRIDAGRIFGRLALQNINVSYDSKYNLWKGGASFIPFSGPLARYALPSISGSFGLTVNPVGFGSVDIEVSNINKPIGPYVFLQKLGGAVTKVPPPLTIKGTAGVSLGPKATLPVVGKVAALEADGAMSYQPPTTLGLSGSMKVLGQQFADASVDANFAEATANLDGNLNLTLAGTGVNGRLEGWLRRNEFQLGGSANMVVFGKSVSGADAFVNNRATGACRRGFGPDWGFTFEYKSGKPKAMMTSCSFGNLRYAGARSAAAQTGAQTLRVGAGSPGEMIRVHSDGGQPAVAVRGPRGAAFDVGPAVAFTEQPAYTAIRDEASGDLWLILNKPARGQWTITPLAGTPAIAPIGSARAKPQPKLTAKRSKLGGGRYAVRWSARSLSRGDRIRFVESGPGGVVRTITTSSKRSGTVRFRPAVGPKGKRTITASVLRGRATVLERKAGSFTLRRMVRPSAPRGVSVKRKGLTVTAKWKGANPGGGWLVSLRTKDGRRYEEVVRRRSLTFYGVARKTAGKVTVRGLSRGAAESGATSRTLKAAKSKSKSKKKPKKSKTKRARGR